MWTIVSSVEQGRGQQLQFYLCLFFSLDLISLIFLYVAGSVYFVLTVSPIVFPFAIPNIIQILFNSLQVKSSFLYKVIQYLLLYFRFYSQWCRINTCLSVNAPSSVFTWLNLNLYARKLSTFLKETCDSVKVSLSYVEILVCLLTLIPPSWLHKLYFWSFHDCPLFHYLSSCPSPPLPSFILCWKSNRELHAS